MIILTQTSDILQVNLGSTVSTNQLKCFASYRETTSTTITPARNFVTTNNLTSVNLVASPTASTQHIVDFINIFNADTSSSSVTILLNTGSQTFNLMVSTLQPNERIQYQEGDGFSVYTSDGSRKQNWNSTSPTLENKINFVALSADVGVSTTALADITNLFFSAEANSTYWFRFVIPYTSTLVGNGARFTINGPSSPTLLIYQSEYPSGAAATTINRGLTSYDSPAAANAASATTGSNVAIIEGVITTSTGGNIIGRFGSENAGQTITAKQGAVIFYQKIN